MKLIHIIAGSQYGGAERFCCDLVNALSKRGVDQHVITRSYPERIKSLRGNGCEVSLVRMGNFFDFHSSIKIKKVIKKIKPQVVMGWMSRGASYISNQTNLKVGRLGGYYKLKYFKNCDQLICNTPQLVDYCIKNNWPKEKVHYIPNFSPITDYAILHRSDFNIPKGAVVLLILARLEEKKGIDLAIKAVSKIPNAYLLIAGEGSMKNALLGLSQSLNVKDRVLFLGWRDDRESLLKLADICLVTSVVEPFGNVVLNAWVSRTPIISTNSEGPSFLIKNYKNGILFSNNDLNDLVSSIFMLINSKDIVSEIIENGWIEANTDFSEETVTAAYIDFFDSYC